MRKFYLAVFTVLISYHSSCGQETISKIIKRYFRSDPFKTEFSSFLSHLMNDPTLINKLTEKRTDSTLFYFEGTYTTHNPFFFKPKRVDVILTQTVVALDSLPADTIYSYQLLAWGNDTKEGTEELKKEFEKIYRQYKNSFSKSQHIENPAASKWKGATYNFFDLFHAVSPFALSWFEPGENKEVCLILTIRMDSYMNMAILPVPFYTLQ
jgi:hypothetical protein